MVFMKYEIRRSLGIAAAVAALALGACDDEDKDEPDTGCTAAVCVHGTCNADDTCTCAPGYTGATCNTEVECTTDMSATPVMFGGVWILQTGGAAAARSVIDQADLLVNEINNNCGVLGDATGGVPIQFEMRDGNDDAVLSPQYTNELIDLGAVVITGVVGSGSSNPSAVAALNRGVAFGMYSNAANMTSNCTQAEIDNPAITKSATPIYDPGNACFDGKWLVYREAPTGMTWGAAVARYAETEWPTVTKAAMIFIAGDTNSPGTRDGFSNVFVANGGEPLTVATSTIAATANAAAIMPVLKQVAEAANPQLLIGLFRAGTFKNLISAYVTLRDDSTWTTKPSNFDTMKFVDLQQTAGSGFGDVPAASMTVLVNSARIIQGGWDTASPGYTKWYELYSSFNPSPEPVVYPQKMRNYDMFVLAALAMTKAGTSDATVWAPMLRDVANPPGTIIYPGELKKARQLLAAGQDIDYEGASGNCDLDERNDAAGTPFEAFTFVSDGTNASMGFIP